MSSIALKFTSLAIRTLSKPIANYIKKQSREHPGFRKVCIGFAQSIHRADMRWRIGLLQDTAALERQAKRDAAREQAKKQEANAPTVKTEAQTKADEEAAAKGEEEPKSSSEKRSTPKIRPLSEAKAIETGANFISETFLFSVAAGLILFESWRSRRKETNRREDVKERLDDLEESEKAARRALIELEHEVLRLRAKESKGTIPIQNRILPKDIYDPPQDDDKDEEVTRGWLSRIGTYITSRKDGDAEEAKEVLENEAQGPAEKILAESDKAIEEKHRQQAVEDAAKAAGISKASVKADAVKNDSIRKDSTQKDI